MHLFQVAFLVRYPEAKIVISHDNNVNFEEFFLFLLENSLFRLLILLMFLNEFIFSLFSYFCWQGVRLLATSP